MEKKASAAPKRPKKGGPVVASFETEPNAPESGPVEDIVLQYGGAEWTFSGFREKAIASFVAEGRRKEDIKKLAVYVKPEEHRIYYVVNGELTGSTELD